MLTHRHIRKAKGVDKKSPDDPMTRPTDDPRKPAPKRKFMLIDWVGRIEAEEFSYPAADHHGHNRRVDTNIMPFVDAEIRAFIEKYGNTTGLTDKSKFVRCAIHKLLEWFQNEKDEKSFSNLGALISEYTEQARQEEGFSQVAEFFKGTDEHIYKLRAIGAYDRAQERLTKLQEMIAQIDVPFWKARYQEEFDRRYGGLK